MTNPKEINLGKINYSEVTSMFNEKLKFLRERKELSQTQLAKILHIDRTTLSYHELGKSMPRYPTLIKIAQVFKISLDYLLLDEIDLFDYDRYATQRNQRKACERLNHI